MTDASNAPDPLDADDTPDLDGVPAAAGGNDDTDPVQGEGQDDSY